MRRRGTSGHRCAKYSMWTDEPFSVRYGSLYLAPFSAEEASDKAGLSAALRVTQTPTKVWD